MLTTLERVTAYIDDEEQITSEQHDAIVSDARITVVRACPGSGKTRAFAARFAWDVATTTGSRCGVAALSFTNVAQQEVRTRVRALDVPDGHPHFVGTIDSFLLRFVVRRFGGGTVNLDRFSHPVADGDYATQTAQLPYGPGSNNYSRLSALRFGVDEKGRIRAEYVTPDNTVFVVPPGYLDAIVTAKKAAWQNGELTHSDVVAIALKLLRQSRIADIVAGRFPRILVDEFQDTTGVRERCLRYLFESLKFRRGLVVGDPDQCIMEFAGARPELFDEFEKLQGATPFRLTACFRSHPGIVKVTSALRDPAAVVDGRRKITDSSETVLVTHNLTARATDGSVAAITELFAKLSGERRIELRDGIVLAWKDNDVARLGGLRRRHLPLTAPAFAHVIGALRDLACGRVLEAFLRVERLLAHVIFGVARPPRRTELADHGCGPRAWRLLVMRTLRKLADAPKSETIEAWGLRVREVIERAAGEILATPKKLGGRFPLKVEGKKKKEILSASVADCLPDHTDAVTSTISNIHQVKGQEFRAVCLYVPADKQAAEPILLNAQPPSPDSFSARRVLYVASTRAQDLLVVVLPASWVAELEKHVQGRTFLHSFDRRMSA